MSEGILQRVITPNPKQMECINTVQGPVMVLAGPGTGKTFTVIQRIKFMLSSNIAPESIICLTFSEAAASEMKIRLIKEMGTIALGVNIHTYHAFCNDIIRQYPEQFELLEGVNLIDDITKRNLMKLVVDEYQPKFFRTKLNDAYHYINDHIKASDEIKKNRLTKEMYFNVINTDEHWKPKLQELYLIKEEEQTKADAGKRNRLKGALSDIEKLESKINKATEVWNLHELFEKKLKENNLIDFNDMINLVLDALEDDHDFAQKIAKPYEHFLVDEYQDTNYSQNRLIFNLVNASKSNNIFVVGDDDQIIYGFQGAQTDNLERFLNTYENTKVICLNENNRSTQTILDISYDVISQDEFRIENNKDFVHYNISKKLTAKNAEISSKDKKAEFYCFSDLKQENNYIIEKIKQIIDSDELPKNEKGENDLSQIAILARKNDYLGEFAELLAAQNIPFQINKQKDIFEIKPSILTYFYLKALENKALHSDKIFGLLLSKPFDFNEIDYNFLLEQNRLNRKNFISNILENIDREWIEPDKINNFIKTYKNIFELKSHLSLKSLILEVINRTGILQYYVESPINKLENIASLKKIIDEAVSFSRLNKAANLSEFLEHLDTAFKYDIALSIDKNEYSRNAIQLVTFHGSKGREFEHVFIPNLIATNWEKARIPNEISLPIKKNDFSKDKEETKRAEQLRLLFVAITRAKHSLYLSYSNKIDDKPQQITSLLTNVLNNKNLINENIIELSVDEYSLELQKTMSTGIFDHHFAYEEELKARLKTFILSPSSLNTYINCPREFLYSNIYNIPVFDKDPDTKNYGSAIHKTLEWVVNSAKSQGGYPSKEKAIEMFSKKINQQEFSSELKKIEHEQRGITCFNTYYHRFCEISAEKIVATELRFEVVPVDDHIIKGFIDRVVKNDDGTYSLYDYKTGSAKAKTQINAGGAFEHYYNQLLFYKLAFETSNEGKKVSSVGIIFPEEFEKNFHMDVCDSDNQYIKEKIIDTYEKIHSLKFEPKALLKQNDKNCQYCDYKLLCKLEVL